MNKAAKLIQQINEFVMKADGTQELEELLEGHPNKKKIISSINSYETTIGKLLRDQKAEFIAALKLAAEGKSVDDPIVQAIADTLMEEVEGKDEFDVKMGTTSSDFLSVTVPDLTSAVMDAIDKDIAFDTLSPRTLEWIDEWSKDLGELMKLTTHENVYNTLRNGIEQGLSIQDIELELREHAQFNRNRARRTAITEVLTANSVSQYEAYIQSPAVTGKTWLHSGPKAIDPRPHHVELDDTTIPLEEEFSVGNFSARYPRDTLLPASERVYCHCVLAPSVDEEILGLSKEEKEAIREQQMNELGV